MSESALRWRDFLRRAEALLFDAAPWWLVVSVSGAIGGALALHIFGLRYVLGTSAFWSYPAGDAAMMVTGWNYLAHESWHWPLTQTYATNAPAGVNIIYLDAIPLVAMIGKFFARIFGPGFHPYGAWHLAIYVLQAVFGALVARRLGVRGLLASVACGVLCLTMSAFLLRFYHEGLNAQFVVLWAFFNYVRSRPETRTVSLTIGWAACLVCALLIHPYLAAMALAIAGTAHLRLALQDRRRAAISGVSSIAALVFAWLSAGYVFQKVNFHEGRAFGLASTNLMSLVVPFYSHLFARWLPPTAVQDTTGFQWDGHNFLGYGVLVLVLVSLTAGRRLALDLVRRNVWLALALLLFAVYAPGNRPAFGQHVLFNLSLSDELRAFLATFRATGRFFWPVAYGIVIATTVIVVRRFGRRGTLLVSALALLQLVDSSASWRVITPAFAKPWERYLDWSRWQDALQGHRRVVMYPSYSCWPHGTPDRIYRMEREVEFMAAARGQQTNEGRTARVFANCAGQPQEAEAVAREGLAADTLYVLFRPDYDAEKAAAFSSEHCVDLGDAWACSTSRSAHLKARSPKPRD